jgi:hypothetical protein
LNLRYFHFAASLIILSNEYASLYQNPSYADSISSTISIMTYCAGADPQAIRLHYIIDSFKDVVLSRGANLAQEARPMSTLACSPGANSDPIVSLFMPQEPQNHITTSFQVGIPKVSRRSSLPSGGAAGNPSLMKPAMPPPKATLPIKPEAGLTRSDISALNALGMPQPSGEAQGSRSVTEPESGDSVGGDAEVDFDSFWHFSSASGQAGLNQQPGDDGTTAAFSTIPQGMSGGSRYDGYAGYPVSAGTPGIGGAMGMNASVPLYSPGEFT